MMTGSGGWVRVVRRSLSASIVLLALLAMGSTKAAGNDARLMTHPPGTGYPAQGHRHEKGRRSLASLFRLPLETGNQPSSPFASR